MALEAYEAFKARKTKFMRKAHRLRRRADSILKVLEWALAYQEAPTLLSSNSPPKD